MTNLIADSTVTLNLNTIWAALSILAILGALIFWIARQTGRIDRHDDRLNQGDKWMAGHTNTHEKMMDRIDRLAESQIRAQERDTVLAEQMHELQNWRGRHDEVDRGQSK